MKTRTVLAVAIGLAACQKTEPSAGKKTEQVQQAATALPKPPPTETKSVTDTYHGVEVQDEYRWLESWDDQAVKDWSAGQNKYARAYLDGLENRKDVAKIVGEILRAESVSYSSVGVVNGTTFAMIRQPPKQQPFLAVLKSLDDPSSPDVIVDPNAMDEKGTTSIDWYVPSPDGKLVAVSISKGGSESGDVSVYDVATKKPVFETIERVNGGTAGGDLTWSTDGKSFFYTRYPRAGEREEADLGFYQQLYHHVLGQDPAKDTYILGKDLPKIAEIRVRMHGASGRLLITVQKGDGGEFELYLREKSGKIRKFSEFGDGILAASFGKKDDLYILSRQDAPRGKVVRVPIKTLDIAKATLIVGETENTIVEDFWGPPTIVVTDAHLYIQYQLGGPSTILAFDPSGKRVEGPAIPDVSAVSGMKLVGDEAIIYTRTSFVDPPAVFHFDPTTRVTRKTPLATKSPIDLGDITVVREMATSKDGTKIPVNILLPPGIEKNSKNPTVVYGYGGYGVNITPRSRAWTGALLKKGVIYAVANIRGGGEFGEDWHRQGYLTNKQNVFDDFAAAVQYMIDAKYTNHDKVAILGGSNGGLLMGATMTQHPELATAVVAMVGIYDMLRVELSSNGQFNITEFGTVTKEDHFKAMHAYSPYHRVKDGTKYPATLFTTGANDPRVDPMQSRKMTAKLQAANAAATPILLRTSEDSGHGATGLDEQIDLYTDVVSFLLTQLGG